MSKNKKVKSVCLAGAAISVGVVAAIQASGLSDDFDASFWSQDQLPARNVSYDLANKANYRRVSYPGYKWVDSSTVSESDASHFISGSSYQWSSTDVSSESGADFRSQSGYKWGGHSDPEQTGYKWGVRNYSEQAGYKWGVR